MGVRPRDRPVWELRRTPTIHLLLCTFLTFTLNLRVPGLYPLRACAQHRMGPKKAKAPVKKSGGGGKKISGYMLFCKEQRPIVKEENPDMTFGELGKELGKRWKALSDADKEGYKK